MKGQACTNCKESVTGFYHVRLYLTDTFCDLGEKKNAIVRYRSEVNVSGAIKCLIWVLFLPRGSGRNLYKLREREAIV